MAAAIGLKLANGEFYSILDENSKMTRRLILTTVHDNQQSVQIDLYKSSTRTMADALYIGSLVMEDLRQRPKGDPSIEFVLVSNQDGDISADAVDLDDSGKGEHQTLSVSLKSLEGGGEQFEIPDIEFESDSPAHTGPRERSAGAEIDEYGEKKKFPWVLVVSCALLITAIGLLIWIFLFRNGGGIEDIPGRIRQMIRGEGSEASSFTPPRTSVQTAAGTQSPPAERQPAASAQAAQTQTPAQQSTAAQPQTTPQTSSTQAQQSTAAQALQSPQSSSPQLTPQAAAPPVIQAPAQAPPAAGARGERSSAPVASYRVPSTIPREGAPYVIRYGDTLWDIAEAFYRNPWLYPRIARFNNIRDPDLIISGTTIRVPPRN